MDATAAVLEWRARFTLRACFSRWSIGTMAGVWHARLTPFAQGVSPSQTLRVPTDTPPAIGFDPMRNPMGDEKVSLAPDPAMVAASLAQSSVETVAHSLQPRDPATLGGRLGVSFMGNLQPPNCRLPYRHGWGSGAPADACDAETAAARQEADRVLASCGDHGTPARQAPSQRGWAAEWVQGLGGWQTMYGVGVKVRTGQRGLASCTADTPPRLPGSQWTNCTGEGEVDGMARQVHHNVDIPPVCPPAILRSEYEPAVCDHEATELAGLLNVALGRGEVQVTRGWRSGGFY
jgi:hypothetical protein